MPFQKGNKLGGRDKAPHTIQAEAYKKYLIEQVIKNKAPLVQALIDKGLAGDVPALKEINERSMGKVRDGLDVNVSISLTKLFNATVNGQ